MFSKLFHKDVFLPLKANEIAKKLQGMMNSYFLSNHLKQHIENQEDRSHEYLPDIINKCLSSLKTTQRDCFEIELSDASLDSNTRRWFVTKFCCRIPYSNEQDLVVAIRPKYEDGHVIDFMIVTAWMNSNTDHHSTLDSSKYCSEKEWKELNLKK